MTVTLTIDEDHNIFDDLICEEDTVITGAVDIYIRENFDVAATKSLDTSNGNLYIQNDCIESFNPSGGALTMGTGDMVIHHTYLGGAAYNFAFNGSVACGDWYFRKALDTSIIGCDITLISTFNPIISVGGAVYIENRMPALAFRVLQNGQTIEQGLT